MNNQTKKFFIYTRKSTDDKDRQVRSIADQLSELKELALKEQLEVVDVFVEKQTAKIPGRPLFNEMMERMEKGEASGILAWHPDRLARNSVDGGKVIYLVDTGVISEMKFPTFWFDPTPQGLFMLQVAFGQSKYYSDNLSDNIKLGVRQKLRRGEWLNLAPFGYVNNPKVRNIEPHPTNARVVTLAFQEYAKGSHTFISLAQFLADLGVVTRNQTPLAKVSIKRLLTHRAYLGFVKHGDEWFDGNFEPIVTPALFEAVQKVLQTKERPRKRKIKHDFPFTGLFRCAECGSMISAQWATGKSGGRYRYYRCSKKRGHCSQAYLQESELTRQICARLQTISLCDRYTDWMLNKVKVWEREKIGASQSEVQNLSDGIKANEERMEKLLSAYLDGDVPKEVYLKRKDVLMRSHAALKEKMKDFERGRNNWVEPLREWILDTKQADFLSSSSDLYQIKSFVQKIGTNPLVRDKSAHFAAPVPSQFVAKRRALLPTPAPSARASSHLSDSEVSFCGDGEI